MSGTYGELTCPVCEEQTTVPKIAGGARIDQCRNCKGAWFDSGELQKAIGVNHRRLPSKALGDRNCPACEEPMKILDFPGTNVEIDLCAQCGGIWLDAGEFRGIREDLGQVEKRKRSKKKPPPDDEDIPGIKGALIRFINSSLTSLTDISGR